MKESFKKYLPIIICILVFITSLFFYIEAGAHLTPASVSVQGYYRQDGTYVRPYNRRPPGGVQHDAPYETTRSVTGLLMFGSGIGTVISVVSIYKDNKGNYKDNKNRKNNNPDQNNGRGSETPLSSCNGCYYLKITRCKPPYMSNCPTYYNKEQRDLENKKHRPM
jgi:hypothetical protein